LENKLGQISYGPRVPHRACGLVLFLSGTIGFLRVFAPQIYGIPVDRIIGTELKLESRMVNDRLVVWRLPGIDAINDKEGKRLASRLPARTRGRRWLRLIFKDH
jgi:hypothetical protein